MDADTDTCIVHHGDHNLGKAIDYVVVQLVKKLRTTVTDASVIYVGVQHTQYACTRCKAHARRCYCRQDICIPYGPSATPRTSVRTRKARQSQHMDLKRQPTVTGAPAFEFMHSQIPLLKRSLTKACLDATNAWSAFNSQIRPLLLVIPAVLLLASAACPVFYR